MRDFLSVAAVVVLGIWLGATFMSGELRFRGSVTRREEDPGMFWVGWGLLALLFGASVLSLLGVIAKF